MQLRFTGGTFNYRRVFRTDPQEFTPFHSILKAASRFALEPRDIIRHSLGNATVEAKRDASQGRIRRRRRKPGFPALFRVRCLTASCARASGEQYAAANASGDCWWPVDCFPMVHGSVDPRVPHEPAASSLRQPGGTSAPLCGCADLGGSVAARRARRSTMRSRSVYWKGSQVKPLVRVLRGAIRPALRASVLPGSRFPLGGGRSIV